MVADIVSIVDEGLGNSSYVVDLGDRRSLVLDPTRDPSGYLAVAERRGLEVAYAVETHLRADFVSGSRELAARGATAAWARGDAPGIRRRPSPSSRPMRRVIGPSSTSARSTSSPSATSPAHTTPRLGALGALAEHAEGPSDGVAVTCGHGERAMTGASLLERHGARDLVVLDGGTSAWVDGGRKLETA